MGSTSFGSKTSRRPASKPLDEVKAQIEPLIKQQKAAAAAQSLANSVESLARSAGMDKAATEKVCR